MRDQQQGSVVFGEHLGEGIAGSDVQVVRGFVENQQVARLKDHAGEGQLVLLAPGEHADAFEYIVAGEQKAGQIVAGLGLGHITD